MSLDAMQNFAARTLRASQPVSLLVVALLCACGGGGGGGAPATPTLTAPLTGAIWGGTRSIAWTPDTTDGGTAQILLSDDGGTSFPTVLASAAPDNGAFRLDTSTLVDGTEYRVRVVLSNGTVLASGDFAVDNTAPVTSLTSPVGSEILGLSSIITWTTTDAHLGTVEIRLSSDGGGTYNYVVAAATPDDGEFDWDTSALVDGVQYRIQLIAVDRATNESLPSRSPQSFQLDVTPPVIQLTAPSGGESWSGLRSITWTTTDSNPGTVALTLSLDSGVTFDETIDADAPDTGTYAWQTGHAPDSATLRVRAVARDLGGNLSTPSVSPASFSVANLRVLDPVHFLDSNRSGTVDSGDQLYFKFDKPIVFNGTPTSGFALPVASDTFGAGAAVALGPEFDTVVLTLGTAPTLRTRGEHADSEIAAGRPSGVDVSPSLAANAIESVGTGLDAVPSGTKDVRPGLVAVSAGFTTAGTATSVAAGDLDRDGHMDFVVGEATGAGLGLLFGDGAGGFTYSVGPVVTAVELAVGDVDSDGVLDLVVATGTAVRVSLGTGGGAFAAFGAPIGGSAVSCVALGDLDCDGDLDVCAGNVGGGADLVLMNDGAGGFTNSGQALGSGNTESLALGDLDGDGDLDLVTASNGGQPVRAWLNAGDGTFTAGDTLTVALAQDVALGDMDGDGDLDCVLAVIGQNEVILNDGTGAFADTHQYFGSNDNRAAALVDLDGDGDLDVAIVKDLDSERWMFNDGTGTLSESTMRGLPDNAVGIAAARIDGDSDMDLFVAVDGAVHRVYFPSASGGQPSATFTLAAASIPAVAASGGVSGDFDGNGAIDVALSGVATGARVLFNDGLANFAAGAAFGASDTAVIAAADIDGDGDLDLVVDDPVASGASIRWNDGSGVFTAGPTGLLAPVSSFVDADGDCALDYVAVDALGDPVLRLGDGAGGFVDSSAVLGNGPIEVGAIADLDHDGVMDVVVGTAGEFRIALGAGSGITASTVTETTGTSNRFVLVDFDADGDLDVLTYSTILGPLEPLRNDLAGAFTALATTGPNAVYSGLALLDHDEDGDLDLCVWAASPTFELRVLTSDGAGGYSLLDADSVSDLTHVVVADFDDDGDADTFVVRYDFDSAAAREHRLYVRD
jgi:hypothetical protein